MSIVVDWSPIVVVAGVALYLVFASKSPDRTSASGTAPVPVEVAAPAHEQDMAPVSVPRGAEQPPVRMAGREEIVETSGPIRPVPPESVASAPAAPAAASESSPTASTVPPSPSPDSANSSDRIYTDEEISALEDQKQYHGDDPIVRSRLGIPSRDTHKLIR